MEKLQTNFNILKKSVTRNWLKLVPKSSEKTLSRKSKNLYQITIFSLSGNEASHNLIRAVACGGASGARPPHLKSVPHISRLAPQLLHTSNTVLHKCAPPFWILAPLLLNTGYGPDFNVAMFA